MPVTAAQWPSVWENETLAWHPLFSEDLQVLHCTWGSYFSLTTIKGVT